MAHYMKLFDSDFLGAWDLVDRDGKPRDYTMLVERVEGGELMTVGGKVTRKPVLTLKGAKKRLALNKTNAKTIAAMYGPDVMAWVGKYVTIYGTTTTFGRATVPCIRVRPGIPKAGSTPGGIPDRPVDQDMRRQQEAARDDAEREPGEEG